jgi:hypothetical protein
VRLARRPPRRRRASLTGGRCGGWCIGFGLFFIPASGRESAAQEQYGPSGLFKEEVFVNARRALVLALASSGRHATAPGITTTTTAPASSSLRPPCTSVRRRWSSRRPRRRCTCSRPRPSCRRLRPSRSRPQPSRRRPRPRWPRRWSRGITERPDGGPVDVSRESYTGPPSVASPRFRLQPRPSARMMGACPSSSRGAEPCLLSTADRRLGRRCCC